jgi:hypothetical protein
MDAQKTKMFQPTDVKIFDRAWILFVEVPALSGVVKIDVDSVPDELRGKLPRELLQLDARILPRESTREPQRLRMKVQRAMIGLGTRFLNGWLIPDENIERTKDLLGEIKVEYEEWVAPFLEKLEPMIEETCGRFPEWESVIRANAPLRDKVADRMRLRFPHFRISAQSIQDSQDAIAEVDALPCTIAEEIASLVKTSWTEIKGETCAQRFRSVLGTVKQKARGLSFLEPKLRTLVDLIDDVLGQLPRDGAITGRELALVKGLRDLLLNPAEVLGNQQIRVAPIVIPAAPVTATPGTTPAALPIEAPTRDEDEFVSVF